MVRILTRGFSRRFLLLFFADLALAFGAAFAVSEVLTRSGAPLSSFSAQLHEVGLFVLFILSAFFYRDLYDAQACTEGRSLFTRWSQSTAFTLIAILAFSALLPHEKYLGLRAFASAAVGCCVLLVWRHFVRKLLQRHRRLQRVLILGCSDPAKNVAREILDQRIPGFHVAGFIGPKELLGVSLVNPRVVGTYDNLAEVLVLEDISTVIVAEEDRRSILPMEILVNYRLQGGSVFDYTDFMENSIGRIPLSSVKPAWFVFSGGFSRSKFYLRAKRGAEILLSALGLVLTFPISLLVAIITKLESPGPILYRQERVGRDGRNFWMYKFRSMRHDAEEPGNAQWAQKNDSRVTRVGRVIRPLRIDEIPQLWNILKGDMSLVGPRPERPEFVKKLARDIPFYEKRHVVKPGLTGWAQINYPYGASLDDARVKLEYDLYYVKKMSLLLDLFIILKTGKTILFDRTGH
ncbi:MAG TPA: TIGR03013 family PEP-CTERM/XrtA system glycosyltransferase [Planctomycetota bacterium]|jgi:sugar transferase (PEP-CTERM system associated)|nr:TIGR03013 family PEP-CTERM/XrtA system glycosyltransferase [Planctomycetota bacterium]OQC20188.1 MAG: UDP-N-acetylgalactosamine-undecaprenyl-phosphate N-acetylgalactosaminephosphotransferase [Planctomycetes bacterium ADurb.Bin069]NMD36389.1 TIGR03013 family PEP-CTERM/XrtA system glycosyltransferase [Planctomycetota bacterium]HNR99330.1 TIGR03013 family PEP-CTERM/XrtA system glycosyltransferase [Planctomycetota bacterium]HNU26055.1 TIGR03013 family PEP-CTERM/XrtA system glycosyltransferase [P